MSNRILEELKEAISEKALIVCGSGVSKATDPRSPNWRDLIRSGIEESVGWNFADEKWKERRLGELDGDANEWISAADLFTDKLGGQDNGHFSKWLERSVGKLEIRDRSLVDAIIGLRCPIATTNYDDLLAKATDLPAIPWTDKGQFIRAIKDGDGILHLHGHWKRSESIILGTKSYQQIANDERAQFIERFLSFQHSLIFIGCSEDGLSDQNLGKLKVWLEGWNGHGRVHFHLVTNGELELNRPNAPIKMLGYGHSHSDLPGFLQSLAPTGVMAGATVRSPVVAASIVEHQLRTIDHDVAREECFGREAEIDEIVSALSTGKTPVAISGGPGMGKTTIAINALYDQRTKVQFGSRRVFVPLDAAREPHAILTSFASALGLPAAGGDNQLISIIGVECSKAPIAVILDNFDTPHAVDAASSERILRLLGQIDNLSFVVTARGTAPHFGQKTDIINVNPLTRDAAKQAFLAIAGQSVQHDAHLDALLEALEDHPLSIVLLAAQARGQPKLADLRIAFERQKSELLRKPGVTREDRLTSTRASLKLSLEHPIMSPLAKRLFALLALLPGGMSQQYADTILGKDVYLAKQGLLTLRLAFDRGDGRLRVLAPLRDCGRLDCMPQELDKKFLIDIFLSVSRMAFKVADSGWAGVATRVMTEADNLDTILDYAVSSDYAWEELRVPLEGLIDLHRFTGLASISAARAALERFRQNPDAYAGLQLAYSQTMSSRSDYDSAVRSAKIALQSYRKAQAKRGEALCLIQLGEVAFIQSDHSVARKMLEEALDILPPTALRGRAACFRILCSIHLVHLELEAARTKCEQAIALCREAEDPVGHANCLLELSKIFLRLHDFKSSEESCDQALEISREIGAISVEGQVYSEMGWLKISQYRAESARENFNQALHLAQKTGDLLSEANSVFGLSILARRTFRFEEALSMINKARETYCRVGEVLGAANCDQELADIAIGNSDHDHARVHLERAQATYARHRYSNDEMRYILSLGIIAMREGNVTAAQAAFKQGLTRSSDLKDRELEMNFLMQLSRLAFLNGELTRVPELLARAKAHISETDDILWQADWAEQEGEIAFSSGNLEKARLNFQDALGLHSRIDSYFDDGNIHWRLGELEFHAGNSGSSLFVQAIRQKRRFKLDRALPGWEALFALKSDADADTKSLQDAVRDAWLKIGRYDLVSRYLDFHL